jgi:hypothetical protein
LPDTNRRAVTSKEALPKHRKTIIYYAEGDETNLLYRCWHCNSINNADKNTVGDGNGNQYAEVTNIITVGKNIPFGDPLAIISVLDGGVNNYQVAKNPNWIERHLVYPSAIQGCWNCGCKNYR